MSNLVDQLVVKTDSEDVKSLNEMRWLSNLMGNVYQAQIDQLKSLASLVFKPDIAVISIATDRHFVYIESSGKETVTTKKYVEMVKYVLGETWAVDIAYKVNHENENRPTKTRKKRDTTKPKGKKRTRNVRGKR